MTAERIPYLIMGCIEQRLDSILHDYGVVIPEWDAITVDHDKGNQYYIRIYKGLLIVEVTVEYLEEIDECRVLRVKKDSAVEWIARVVPYA